MKSSRRRLTHCPPSNPENKIQKLFFLSEVISGFFLPHQPIHQPIAQSNLPSFDHNRYFYSTFTSV
jgi:hypothetical protein